MIKITLIPFEGKKKVMIPTGKEDVLRQVGELVENTFITKRDPEKHVMRRWNAYGIAADIIDSGLFEVVVFQEPTASFMITVDDIKIESRLEHVEGEQVQYFVPREKLQKL